MMARFKLILTAFFWGGTFVAGRIVAQTHHPFSAAFLRFTLASLLFIPVILRSEDGFVRLNIRQWIAVGLLGLTGVFAYNILFFFGLKYIHSARAAVIIATNPIFIALFAALFFKEKLDTWKGMGIVLSVTGAAIVISGGRISSLFSRSGNVGDLLIFGCVACWVTYTLIGKSAMTDLSPLTVVSYSSIIGTFALLIPAVTHGLYKDWISLTLREGISLAYLAICGTVLGFLWYYQGVKEIGPTKAGIFINFVPVSAILLARLILGEPVSTSLISGTVLVVGGVTMTNLNRLRIKINR